MGDPGARDLRPRASSASSPRPPHLAANPGAHRPGPQTTPERDRLVHPPRARHGRAGRPRLLSRRWPPPARELDPKPPRLLRERRDPPPPDAGRWSPDLFDLVCVNRYFTAGTPTLVTWSRPSRGPGGRAAGLGPATARPIVGHRGSGPTPSAGLHAPGPPVHVVRGLPGRRLIAMSARVFRRIPEVIGEPRVELSPTSRRPAQAVQPAGRQPPKASSTRDRQPKGRRLAAA